MAARVDVRRNVLLRTRQVRCQPSRFAPGWVMTANPVGGVTLLPRNNPGWALIVSNVARAGTTIAGGYATLLHNGVLIGVGQCAQRTVPTAATVGDVAPE